MTEARVKLIVDDIVEAVRDVLRKHQVTFPEYRAGFFHLLETAKSGEMGLLIDMLFNQTVCDIEMQSREGTRFCVEGPYFLEGAPEVKDAIKLRGDYEPLLIRGQIASTDGAPLQDAVLDVWFADPDGFYSGFEDDFPIEYCRGKVRTDADGHYSVQASVPGEYPITRERHGPTGQLVEMLGRQGWRPAHVHFKANRDGFRSLTTQAYFEGGNYLDNDPVEAVFDDLTHATRQEDGTRVLEVNFTLDPA